MKSTLIMSIITICGIYLVSINVIASSKQVIASIISMSVIIKMYVYVNYQHFRHDYISIYVDYFSYYVKKKATLK